MLTEKVRSGTTKDDVEVISNSVVFKGFFRVNLYLLRHRLFQGAWSNIIRREICDTGQVAGVLLYDPRQNQVALIEQFRTALLEDKDSPWSLEIVAGLLQNDETKDALAIREAKEEANADITQLIPICTYWESPGSSNKQVSAYCGIVDASQLGGLYGLKHENEDIRVHVIDATKAFQMVKTGIINNGLAIITLQWLELNLHRIQDFLKNCN